MSKDPDPFTVVIPAFDEEDSIEQTIDEIAESIGNAAGFTILVVNDGSNDGTGDILSSLQASGEHPYLRVVTHPRNLGYGASLKTGIRSSSTDLIAITDADGTYPNHRMVELVAAASEADMVVGARSASEGMTYSKIRRIPKIFLCNWVSWLSGRNVPDMNSGMRVFRKDVAVKFFRILPDSFSFTTTQTLCMHRNRYRVKYIPIGYNSRVGKSKIKPIRDTLRFTQLILRTGMYFAPLRCLAPVIFTLLCAFLASLYYDIMILSNLTDKTVMLFLFSMNTSIFALLADMVDKRSSL